MKKNIIITIIAIILIFNYTPINYILKENYTYSNFDGSFTFSEEGGKGFNYTSVIRAYTYFLCQHPEKDQGDNRLYRTFAFKPWCFWEWGQMIFHSDRFLLSYKKR